MTIINQLYKKFLVSILVIILLLTNVYGISNAQTKINPSSSENELEVQTSIRSENKFSPNSNLIMSVSGAVYDHDNKLDSNELEKLVYKFSQEEINTLMLNGLDYDDIIYALYLGNKWLVDPFILIAQKKESDKTWSIIENELEQSNSDFLTSVTKATYLETSYMNFRNKLEINGMGDSILNGLITQQQINQTNKPQYADRNSSAEIIDPASGKLTWKSSYFNLPGREGLDLNIGIMYDSNNSAHYIRNYGTEGQIKKYNYLESRYDLGMGWSFQFPSIQLADGYLYYHSGTGAIYRIDFDSQDEASNFTHLIGYQGKDLKLVQDQEGIFSNGQAFSAYYLEYANKKREYFADDGRLLGIVDRFGNTIKFEHIDREIYDGSIYKVISSITDTVGRVVTFDYETTLQNEADFYGENIIITVLDPNGIPGQSIIFNKNRIPSQFNGMPDGYVPILEYVQNQNNENTYFKYEVGKGCFHYDKKQQDDSSGWNSYVKLDEVDYPNSLSIYSYETVIRNLGKDGFGEEFRVNQRKDLLKKREDVSNDYSSKSISYYKDYTGYPEFEDSSDLPESYRYSVTETIISQSDTNGLVTKNNFNGKGQVLSTEIISPNGEKKTQENTMFHPIFTNKPITIVDAVYGINDNPETANKLYISLDYTDWGGVQSETKPLTLDQYNNIEGKTKYTTYYTYEPNYYFLDSQSWYQNVDEELLRESYSYYSDGRLKSYSNALNEMTTYCYESIETNNQVESSCNSSKSIDGKVQKVTITRQLRDGETSVKETIFDESTDFAYPIEEKSYFTTKDSSNNDVTQIVKRSMKYDMGTGLLIEEVDGNNEKTTYSYDLLGRVKFIKYPSITNLNNQKFEVMDEFSYENSNIPSSDYSENTGLNSLMVESKRKYTNSLNQATTVSRQKSYYDGFGILRYNLAYYNTNSAYVTQYLIDDLTRMRSTLDSMNNSTLYSYDTWGNPLSTQDAFGNLYVSEYFPREQIVKSYMITEENIADYKQNPSLNELKINYAEQEFDQWGQLKTIRAYKSWPESTSPIFENYEYDLQGNIIGYTDPNQNLNEDGVTTRISYDSLDRIVSIKDAIGQISSYEYDINGQIISTSMQKDEADIPKQISSKTYNELGMISSKINPNLNLERYNYNSTGLISERIDPNEVVFNYQYDEQNNHTQIVAEGNGIRQKYKHLIGNYNSILNDKYEITTENGYGREIQTSKDVLNRIVRKNSNSFSADYVYDGNNRITTLKSMYNGYSSFGTIYKYEKHRLDKVQTDGNSVNDDSLNANAEYDYFPDGKLKSLTYPPLTNGSKIKTEYSYDKIGRMISIVNTNGSTIFSSTNYEYDNNGNIITTTQTGINESKTNRYNYDKLNRLVEVLRFDAENIKYSYDLYGNRITIEESSPFPYDMNANTYEFDLFNRIISIKNGLYDVNFDYGPDGMRNEKLIRDINSKFSTFRYHYNQNDEVIVESDRSNKAIANYVRGDRLLVKKDIITSKDYYYLYNGHGDVIQIVDTDGNIVNSYEYDEWGNITYQVEGITNSFKYSGEVYDEETGLYYLRARYYDPSIGRFISEDTYEGQIDNPLTLNLYTYVLNNPLIRIDPTGHDSYVLYTTNKKSDFSDQANYMKKKLESGGEIVHSVVVNNVEDFTTAWNSMGIFEGKKVDINNVVIYSHMNARTILLEDGTETNAFTIDGKNKAGEAVGDLRSLYPKHIKELYLYGCNAGHLDAFNTGNLASFMVEKKVLDGVVYAYDGNVSFGNPFLRGVTGNLEDKLSSPWTQKGFHETSNYYSNRKRVPLGKLKYFVGENGIVFATNDF